MIKSKFLYANNASFDEIRVKNSYQSEIYMDDIDLPNLVNLSKNLSFARIVYLYNDNKFPKNKAKKITEAMKNAKKMRKLTVKSITNNIITGQVLRLLYKCPKLMIKTNGKYICEDTSEKKILKRDYIKMCKYGIFMQEGNPIELPFRNLPDYYSLMDLNFKKHDIYNFRKLKNLDHIGIDLNSRYNSWDINYGLPCKLRETKKIRTLRSIDLQLFAINNKIVQYVLDNLPNVEQIENFSLTFEMQHKALNLFRKLEMLQKCIKSAVKIKLCSEGGNNNYDYRIFDALLKFFDCSSKLSDIEIKFNAICDHMETYFMFLSQMLIRYDKLKSLKLIIHSYNPTKKIFPILPTDSKLEKFDLSIQNYWPPSNRHQMKIGKEICQYLNAPKRFGTFRFFRLQTESIWDPIFYKLIGEEIECYQGLETVEIQGFNSRSDKMNVCPFILWKDLNILCSVVINLEINKSKNLIINNNFFDGLQCIQGELKIHLIVSKRDDDSLNELKKIYDAIIFFNECIGDSMNNNLQKNILVQISCEQTYWGFENYYQVSDQQYFEQARKLLGNDIKILI